MGQTISALEATPKIWDLAAAWLVLHELNCPIRWLERDPARLQAGEDLSQANFPVLAARDAQTLATFKPWADALVSPT
jgi:myo-inositol-1(or 4)-monophosphatase